MIVTHQLTIDLKERGSLPKVEATQEDQYTRDLAITLVSGGESWPVPEDATVVIRYCKSDGVGGEYDTLPDGTAAWHAEENVLTLALAPQVLTVPGTVMLSATLIREQEMISLFSVAIHVRRSVRAIAAESVPYRNVSAFLPGPVTARTGQFLRVSEVDGDGRILAVEGAEASLGGYYEPADGDIPRLFFGEALPQTKEDTVMPFRYVSRNLDFSGWCKTKAQGNSSMSYPKKNQTVKLYVDEDCSEKKKIDFLGWGSQSKFCCKANWIDLTHARNVVSARLWGDVVRSRAEYDQLPAAYRESPNQGAVDGFPVKVYAAGIYQGRYTLNIPKDAWMAGMEDSLDEHCILCGENYGSGCFRAEATIDGTDWTDEVHDTVPASILTRWNEIIDFVQNSTDEEFVSKIENYFYLDSLIDYHLFGLMSCGLDAYGKNQLYMTYDGQKWIAGMYDMDSTWGLWWTGGSILATDYDRSEYQDFNDGSGNLLYIRLEKCFYEQIQARWEQLRSGPLSKENIILRFEAFTDMVPDALVKEDYAVTTGGGAFTGIPSKTSCTVQQIRNFAAARHGWCDTYVAGLKPSEEISCTGITLSAMALVLNAGDEYTITAAVSPEGCTDPVAWESSDDNVATVRTGVVTAVSSGDAVITATCGNYSASAEVTVKGSSATVNCAALTLSETALTFTGEGSQTLTATVQPEGCTETIVWESSDTTVASVENGLVTAVGNGEAVITAACGTITAQCSVTVSGVADNLLRGISWYVGEISETSGEIVETVTAANYTDYVDIRDYAGTLMLGSCEGCNANYSRLAFFDENLGFLNATKLSSLGLVPEDAAYLRVSVYNGAGKNTVIKGSSDNLWREYEHVEGGYASGSYNAGDTNSCHIRIPVISGLTMGSFGAWGMACLDESDAVLSWSAVQANANKELTIEEGAAILALCATDENAASASVCNWMKQIGSSVIS